MKEILGESSHIAVALNANAQQDSDRQLREAVLQLQIAGLALERLDPYSLAPAPQEETANAALTVQLCANNYVSEKSKSTFEQALQNGHSTKVSAPEPVLEAVASVASPAVASVSASTEQPISSILDRPPPMPISDHNSDRNSGTYFEDPPSAPSPNGHSQTVTVLAPPQPTSEAESQTMAHSSLTNASPLFQRLDESLAQLHQHQSETLQVHALYLNQQMEYAKIYFHLAQQQGNLCADLTQTLPQHSIDPTHLSVLQSLDRNLTQLHEHQTQTLHLHGQSLAHQAEYSRNLFHLAQQNAQAMGEKAASIVEDEVITPVQTSAKHSITSPETPTDRAVVPPAAPLPEPEAVPPSTPSTVTPITPIEVGTNGASTNGAAKSKVVPLRAEISPQRNVPESVATKSENWVRAQVSSLTQPTLETDTTELESVLLTIVSEKTGYPSEMLEVEMDLEADLGIDSIKRVEILGALQERFPSATQPNLEDLAELRTLAQIATYMRQLSTATSPSPNLHPVAEEHLAVSGLEDRSQAIFSNGNGNGSHPKTASVALLEPKNGSLQGGVAPVETKDPVAPNPQESPTVKAISMLPVLERESSLESSAIVQPTLPTTMNDIDVDVDVLSQSLLEIVSEKTGYPAEMLELNMDMEADLGIDSIKRVEILGTVQERFPNLPQPNLEDLAELRTLGQIVNFLGDQTQEKKKSIPELIASPPS